MDIRNAGWLIGRTGRWLDAVNGRHPWSHNDHFHGWILRHLPKRRGSALDVGCGRGQLVGVLAGHFDHVDGIDADAEMARFAARRFAADRRVTVRNLPFEQITGRYDLITMVAVLHHLDLEPALVHARDLLVDGGRLLVVGLARQDTLPDLVWDLTSSVLNPIVGLAKHPRSVTHRDPPPFPVAEPAATFDEVRAVTTRVLPGARVRRRLFFRFTLEWAKP